MTNRDLLDPHDLERRVLHRCCWLAGHDAGACGRAQLLLQGAQPAALWGGGGGWHRPEGYSGLRNATQWRNNGAGGRPLEPRRAAIDIPPAMQHAVKLKCAMLPLLPLLRSTTATTAATWYPGRVKQNW